MAFTVAVIVNIVAIAQKKYTASVGLLAVIPLALQFFTGLYLFVLPYATKWRCGRGVGWAAATGVLWGLSYFFWHRLQSVKEI